MSYQSSRMNSILTLNIIIVLVNSQSTLARMCYVCGKGSEEPFQQNSKSKLEYPYMDIPLSCDEFESSTNLDKFIFTCPSNYVGCITQSDGTDVFRTCDQLPIRDCQTANGIEYCYCNTDLCNTKREISIKMKHETLYDDEDSLDEFEASGYTSIETIFDDTVETTISTSSAIPTIESPSPVTVLTKLTTITTTTTEAITANKVFTTSYNQNHTFPTTTAESTINATSSNFVKCSKVIFIMQLLMLIFPVVAMLS